MAKNKRTSISDELLAAYLDGNTTPEETMQVLHALEHDETLRELLIASERVDAMLEVSDEEFEVLPMEQLAAKTRDSLCDVQCEMFILKALGLSFEEAELSDEAKKNRWLRDKGTPLHNVGRLLESNGLSVVRRYSAYTEDFVSALNGCQHVIVVVNASKLKASEAVRPIKRSVDYHALVVLELDSINHTVKVFDPASSQSSDWYPLSRFLEAWGDAMSYMVCAFPRIPGAGYEPSPVYLEDVELTEELIELREAIAENAHDVWAAARKREGWIYGPVRDDRRKEHPDLVPYSDLPDAEKQYDRDMAMNTIKLVRKLGYELIKGADTELYRSLISKLRQQEDARFCKDCGAPIYKTQLYCEQCGRRLEYEDFI